MIISCPQCDTSYNIPEETLRPSGRKVRCSSCSHRWQVMPPSSTPQPVQSILDDEDTDHDGGQHPDFREEPESEEGEDRFRFSPSGLAQSSLQARTSPKVILGWCALLVMVASLATFVLARQRLAAAFPALQPVYATLGLPIEQPMQLRLSDVGSEEFLEDGRAVIVISGLVINEGEQLQNVPEIEVALLDGDRGVLEASSLGAVESELEAGEITTFEARFPDPPDLAKHFSVRFTDSQIVDE